MSCHVDYEVITTQYSCQNNITL